MTRLTEAAAARTSAEQLDHRAVKDNLRGRNHEGFRIVHVVQVAYNALLDKCRCAVLRRDGLYGSILVIRHIVQRRHVQTFDMARLAQKFVFAPIFALCLTVEIGKLNHNLLAVANLERIDKRGERFRIVRTRAAAHNKVFQRLSVAGAHRNAAQVQHVEHIGERQLILQRKAQNIQFGNRVSAFQSIQRNIGVSQLCFHVNPRRKDALTPNAVLMVEQAI